MIQFTCLVFLVVLVHSQAALGQNEITENENILKWDPPKDMARKYPYYLSGYDQDGSPIWVMEFGKWDLKSAVDAGGKTESDLDKYVQQTFIRFVNSAKNIDGNPGFFIISDLEGYDLAQAGSFKAVQKYLWVVRTFISTIKQGKFKGAYIVNANYLFQTVWNLSKPLFGQVLEDIALFGTNTDAWKPKLLKAIDKNQIPEWYGGSKTHKPLEVYG